MSDLVDFFTGVGTDHAGRKLDEILSWNDEKLEYVHDYIQWIFPNRTASQFNSDAPLLTDDDVHQFKKSPFLMGRMTRVFERMWKFYKLEIGPPYWWDDIRYAHNWLRMTRIILCLRDFGLMQQVDEFHDAIIKSSLPDNRTRSFWFTAAGKPTDP